jgi:hypothetical protein
MRGTATVWLPEYREAGFVVGEIQTEAPIDIYTRDFSLALQPAANL